MRILFILLLVTAPLSGQQWQYTKTIAEVTVGAAAANVFSASDIQGTGGHVQAVLATCSLTGANIRVTWDKQTATTSLGQILVPGEYVFQGTDVLLNLNAIRDDSTSATLNCVVMG